MKFWVAFPRLLSILAVVSILTAPMVTLSAAATMAVDPAAAMAHMASMPDMPSGCLDQSQPDCQKSCPLAALCFAKCFPGVSTAVPTTLARLYVADVTAPGNDVGRDLLPNPPPPRPPRA